MTLSALTSPIYQPLPVDKSFMNVRTTDFVKRLFRPNSQTAELTRTMIESAYQTNVIADHSKTNNQTLLTHTATLFFCWLLRQTLSNQKTPNR
ncbi:hypothetical protein [Facklamia sp. P12934]|uniref:hypothetical protein n=1 Tax=unclassified Facklamia TaxID=2622293 RepID=UPI003D172CD7